MHLNHVILSYTSLISGYIFTRVHKRAAFGRVGSVLYNDGLGKFQTEIRPYNGRGGLMVRALQWSTGGFGELMMWRKNGRAGLAVWRL